MKRLLILAIVLLFIAACTTQAPVGKTPVKGGTENATSQQHGTGTAIAKVDIREYSFDPGSLTVQAGTTVEFVNKGSYSHTVTADNGEFDMALAPGKSFQYTFNTPGTVAYHCAIHQSMKGTVIVQ